MEIPPIGMETSGTGVTFSEQPNEHSVQMSDPVQDFEYARSAVTLTFDLAGVEHVRLRFEALEFGDEPHAPPPGPFGDDVNFDGVAVSADGVNWYEIQGLRGLRSDRYTVFDLDLDALVAGLGLAYNKAFRIRFCQYDDNPAPMDGVSLKRIRLDGDGQPPVLHLPMNDSAEDSTVADAAAEPHHQVFVDPTGNPNTSAHSVAGCIGRGLGFDGVDDRITLTEESHKPYLDANQDFSIAFWWKTNSPDPTKSLYFLSNRNDAESSIFAYTAGGNLHVRVRFGMGVVRWAGPSWTGGADNNWHHYVIVRKGTVLSFFRDGILALSDDHPDNALSLAPSDRNLFIGAAQNGTNASPGSADDFRLYDRALMTLEVQELAQL